MGKFSVNDRVPPPPAVPMGIPQVQPTSNAPSDLRPPEEGSEFAHLKGIGDNVIRETLDKVSKPLEFKPSVETKIQAVREMVADMADKDETLCALSRDQQQTVLEILADDNQGPFFLTGQAGSGKSHVVKFLSEHLPCRKTAFTGVAAQLIGGTTFHRAMRLGARFNRIEVDTVRRQMHGFAFLVIDEVSMMGAHIIEMILNAWAGAKISCPFKIIFTGDFCQLPPVEGEFAFKSQQWQQLVTGLQLSQQHRQSDKRFITALNGLRVGNVLPELMEIVRERTVVNLPTDFTHILPFRNKVAEVNTQRLALLDGDKYTVNAEVRIGPGMSKMAPDKAGEIAGWLAEKNSRFPLVFEFKIGARVMMLRNTDDFVNGTTGTIIKLSEDGTIIVVEEDVTGRTFNVTAMEEEIFNRDKPDVVDIIVEQFPMILGWAVTIHKSQGATLDNVCIDMQGHFAAGMTYVSMSRAKTSEGLYLKGGLSQPKVDAGVLDYLRSRNLI